MLRSCAQGTCSRSIYSDRLSAGSNWHTQCYKAMRSQYFIVECSRGSTTRCSVLISSNCYQILLLKEWITTFRSLCMRKTKRALLNIIHKYRSVMVSSASVNWCTAVTDSRSVDEPECNTISRTLGFIETPIQRSLAR